MATSAATSATWPGTPLTPSGSLDEHVATGAPECQWCPVCRTVHAIREVSPEVREHLATAAASLMQAAAGVLAATGQPRTARQQDVEHIDLDQDGQDSRTGWPEEQE